MLEIIKTSPMQAAILVAINNNKGLRVFIHWSISGEFVLNGCKWQSGRNSSNTNRNNSCLFLWHIATRSFLPHLTNWHGSLHPTRERTHKVKLVILNNYWHHMHITRYNGRKRLKYRFSRTKLFTIYMGIISLVGSNILSDIDSGNGWSSIRRLLHEPLLL